MVVEANFVCAYCGETNETKVDLSAGEVQEYIEDCQVCCQPNSLYVTGRLETGEAWIEAFSDE